MARVTTESNGRSESGAKSEERDFKWAVEWLVKQRGQRQTAEVLGVNRKTVALALRRERLTSRMNHAVQTLIASLDDPGMQEVMPLDRMDSQISDLMESVDEIYGLFDRLILRVKALEEVQAQMQVQAKAEAGEEEDAPGHADDMPDVEERKEGLAQEPAPDPELGRAGLRFGSWGR